ncbi:MAG: alpha/beta fold hydrolase [Thermoleophilaceae bacterium]|nr:alpha/beta fold hydrolase [Thermoleophilaceae bacterium]
MPRVFASHAVPASPRRAREAGADYGQTAEPSWRTVDWTALLRRHPFGGSEINYIDLIPEDPAAHQRTPVVFVHGLGGQWQNWIENIPRSALEQRTVALDLPGFGMSPMPDGEISISMYSEVVEAACRDLSLGPVAVVGNSMGGFIGAELAIRHPERVERLMLVSAAGITTADVYRGPVSALARAGTMLVGYTAARHRELARRPVSRHLALALVARHPSRIAPDLAYEAMLKGAGKPGFEDALGACLDFDFRDRLPEIGCPTLIVWGEDDAILPAGDADEFERLIPDARKVLLRDTGHVPMLERPSTFNDILAGFLSERGSAETHEPAPGATQVA